MTLYALTLEWQKKAAGVFREDPQFERAFKIVNGAYLFEIQAEKALGIETDICILNEVRNGELVKDDFGIVTEESRKLATWCVTGNYAIWKRVLTGKEVFIQAFMAGNIKLIQGDFAGLMRIAAQGTKLPQIFTRNECKWPDEFSPDEMEEYKAQFKTLKTVT